MKQLLFLYNRRKCYKLKINNVLFFPYYANKLSNFEHRTFDHIKKTENLRYLKNLKPDLILSLLSKEIIPASIIEIPRYGCVNIHPALLPDYRGVSPTFWCLSKNEKRTGVTIHFVIPGIDAGPIIDQKVFSTEGCDSEHQLYLRCMNEGFDLLYGFFERLKKNPDNIESRSQNLSAGSYHSLPTRRAMKIFLRNGYSLYKWKDFQLE